jgi:hypothetical protein
MTDQELGIKVLQHMGWRLIEDDPVRHPYYLKDERMIRVDTFEVWAGQFVNDLNAMYEAVETLSKEQKQHFVAILRWTETGYLEPEDYINATARQRAEAFVKVKEMK